MSRPMTRGEYNNYRDWAIPSDEDPSDQGYLVEYTDGGKPNHSDHQGYISWSPKDQFDNAYSIATTNKQRLEIELAQMKFNADYLAGYLVADHSLSKVPVNIRVLLDAQLGLMNGYIAILEARLAVCGVLSA